MEQTEFAQRLMEFGLTRQEALLYESLLQMEFCSGYELAKQTGISRSNVYGSLASLTEKGAVRAREEGSSRKYIAVKPEEFCGNYIRKLQESKAWLVEHTPQSRKEEAGYITIEGRTHILNKVKNLLEAVRERVYISCEIQVLALFEKELECLAGRGKKVVVLTDGRYHLKGEQVQCYNCPRKQGQIGVITDSQYALTGEIGTGRGDTCLYSGQTNFVELYKQALANEIELIKYRKMENGKEILK